MKKYSSFFFGLVLVLTLTMSNAYAKTDTFPEIETSKLSWYQCSGGFWVKRCLYGTGDCGVSDQILCEEVNP